MSLTSHLNDPGSPVLAFMRERFPNTRTLSGRLNGELKGAATIVPPDRKGYPASVVGSAADFRIRFYFPVEDDGPRIARAGALLLKRGSTHAYAHEHENFGAMMERMDGVARASDELFRTLDGFLGRVKPAGRTLPDAEEERLCRCCFVLACFEQVFRTGGHPGNPLFSENAATAHALLALPPTDAIRDLEEISRGFQETRADLLPLAASLNPNFAGSPEVGGADTDLIVDRSLLEIKTLATPKITGKMLHQLVGYVLLDYEDEHDIAKVGFYLARQKALHVVSIENVLADLPALRDAFRGIVRRGT